MNWNDEAKSIIKAEKARKGLEWSDISALLKEKLDIDIDSRLLTNRVNGGAFSFALALQILTVLEVDSITIKPIEKRK